MQITHFKPLEIHMVWNWHKQRSKRGLFILTDHVNQSWIQVGLDWNTDNWIVHLFNSGTVEDTELVEGLVLEQKISHLAGGISQIEKARIGLIQFCISPPKTDVSRLMEFCIILQG